MTTMTVVWKPSRSFVTAMIWLRSSSKRLRANGEKKRSASGATTSVIDASHSAEVSGVGVYGAFVDAELRAQDARKVSFEQRGLAVVTTSGVLVTLLFALAGLSTKSKATFVLPHSARLWLVAALVAFVLAAVAALATNFPMPYEAVTSDEIEGRLKEPIRSEYRAERDVALTRVKALRDAKGKNTTKGRLLFVAIGLEVVAVALVGAAVWLVIAP
jgi:hypothetical protein